MSIERNVKDATSLSRYVASRTFLADYPQRLIFYTYLFSASSLFRSVTWRHEDVMRAEIPDVFFSRAESERMILTVIVI